MLSDTDQIPHDPQPVRVRADGVGVLFNQPLRLVALLDFLLLHFLHPFPIFLVALGDAQFGNIAFLKLLEFLNCSKGRNKWTYDVANTADGYDIVSQNASDEVKFKLASSRGRESPIQAALSSPSDPQRHLRCVAAIDL